MKLTTLTMTLVAAAAAAASAQETRELGAHEHGRGALNIAVEGDIVAMELEVPGFDLVGFEHAAESADDREAVENAVAQLARPADLFSFPEAAACSVTEASVELLGGEHHEDDHAEGAEHADHEEHEAEVEHADHDEHESQAAHSEFHASYQFVCDDIGALTAIDFPYFEVFPNAEELEVQLATNAGASSAEVERDAPKLDLSGLM